MTFAAAPRASRRRGRLRRAWSTCLLAPLVLALRPPAGCSSASRSGTGRDPAPRRGSAPPAGPGPRTAGRRAAGQPPRRRGPGRTPAGPGRSRRRRPRPPARRAPCPRRQGRAPLPRRGCVTNVRSASGSTSATSKPVSRSGSARPEQADALGGQGGADHVAPRAGAVPAGVEHRQALAGRGGHHVEPAAGQDLGGRRQDVAAALRQRRDAHHHVDDRLAREDEPPRAGRAHARHRSG